MAQALTVAERLARGEDARQAAWEFARQVTADTPPRTRGGLIIKTRSRGIAANNAVLRIANGRFKGATESDVLRALTILDDCEDALHHARRFSK